jgi:hypothetical protein
MEVHRFLPAILLSVLLLSVSPPAISQNTGGVPVRITVTVEPKHGDQIPPITRQDIIVTQGHDRRPVTDWAQAQGNQGGLALAILIDDSSGFSLGTELNDIRAFITQQPPTTLLAIGYMQNGTVRMAQNFTQDHAAAAKAIRLTQGFLGIEASPYFSLSQLIKGWSASPSIPRREVLMITSGIDTYYGGGIPDPYVDAAIHDAQCADIPVFSIYTPAAGHFGHSYWRINWGQNYLSELAEETGAESYYLLGPEAPVSFQPYLSKLSRQLNQQFLLTFIAKPEKKASTQRVRISSEIYTVDFLAADRVCVPASPGE